MFHNHLTPLVPVSIIVITLHTTMAFTATFFRSSSRTIPAYTTNFCQVQRNKTYLIQRNQARFSSRAGVGNDTLHTSEQNENVNKENSMGGNDEIAQKARIVALHTQLRSLTNNIDPISLASAAHKSLTTTEGYDPEYGKSAIRAYRTYLKYPPSNPNEDVTVAATRTARQIDFLVKRHKSQMAEWIRHLDADDEESKKKRKVFPLSLILDNVRSAFNVGSIFRTADACGCTEVITTGITPHPGGSGREKLSKCALGADAAVPTRHFATTEEAIKALREEGSAMLVGMETTDRSQLYTSKKIYYQQEGKGTFLILGNEVSGVDTEIMDMLDIIVEIPMFGAKNSLNIAASAPIVMYEVLRQWGALEIDDGGNGDDFN